EPVQAAAAREVAEETGLVVRPLHVFTAVDAFHRNASGQLVTHYVLIAVLCEWISGVPQAAGDALEAEWFPIETLDSVDIVMSFDVARVASMAARVRDEMTPVKDRIGPLQICGCAHSRCLKPVTGPASHFQRSPMGPHPSSSPGAIFTHITSPQVEMSAATSNEAVQPQLSASQGVSVGQVGLSKDYGAKSSASRVRIWARVTSVIVPTRLTNRLLSTVRI
ncbi:MAG: NUDIX domain-containing protein, partial [Nitrospira sp.]|nr:NUDIX domain-containing protein [Nitrospira sp.]